MCFDFKAFILEISIMKSLDLNHGYSPSIKFLKPK